MKTQKKLCPTSYYYRRKTFLNRLKHKQIGQTNNYVHNVSISLAPMPISSVPESVQTELCEIDCQVQPNLNNFGAEFSSDSDSNQVQFDSNYFETEPPGECFSSNDITNDISNDLHQWALRHSVTHRALSDLLTILKKKYNHVVPLDARTLLKTPMTVSIDQIKSGDLWYHGIAQCLYQSVFANCIQNSTVSVNFNIDGLPIHNSGPSQFWPILMNFVGRPEIKPMVVSIYLGKSKPETIEQYLRKFVSDFNEGATNGYRMPSGATIKINLNAFICDRPARALLKCNIYVFNYM